MATTVSIVGAVLVLSFSGLLAMAGLSVPTEALFTVKLVKVSPLPAARPHDFNTVICAECGEVTVKRYARIKGGKVVCISCAEKR